MTGRAPKNIMPSIHQRLLNVSKQTGRPFNDLVMYYAIERFLYRLSQSCRPITVRRSWQRSSRP